MGVKVSDGLNGDEWFVSNQNVLGYRDSDGVGEWMEGEVWMGECVGGSYDG